MTQQKTVKKYEEQMGFPLTLGGDEEKGTLDVGCGTERYAKGTFNVDCCREGFNKQIGNQNTGELVEPKKIRNFVVADACHLPFRDGVFEASFSSHTIEHTANPLLMFGEMNRVTRGRVKIRCPHRSGSGAKRPFHRQYLDEDWFRQAAERSGLRHEELVTSWDYPISNRIPLLSKMIAAEHPLGKVLQRSLPWRALRKLERTQLLDRAKIPFEVESDSWSKDAFERPIECDPVTFLVVSNNESKLEESFLSSSFVQRRIIQPNVNSSIPVLYNALIDQALDSADQEQWLAFCHQDFILKEDLQEVMAGKDANAIYGVIGARLPNEILGRILQTDGSYVGSHLNEPEPVQTLDEMCIIAHSSLLRSLRFDGAYNFHFYGADLCMAAHYRGFGVYALQVECQHKSDSLKGADNGVDFAFCKRHFKGKWRKFLPIRTTSALVHQGE